MRILPPAEHTDGYEAPSTEYTTPDLAVLDTDDLWESQSTDRADELPAEIRVKVLLDPLPLTDPSARVRLVAGETLLPPQNLYDHDTVCHALEHPLEHYQLQAVALRFEGSPGGELLQLEPDHVIYNKPFAVQMANIIEEARVNPKEEPRHIYGYGGLYADGLPPGEIQQVYFELFEGLERTEISLTTTSQWMERGIIPLTPSHFGGQQVITDPNVTYEHSLSLGQALEEGYARLQIPGPGPEPILYASRAYQRVTGRPNGLEITFTRQGVAE